MNKNILWLAMPAIVSNITVPLLGLVDLSIVGHMGDERYIAAIAIGSMVFNMIYWIMAFLRMGTSGITAQAWGGNDFKSIVRMLRQTLAIAVGIGSIFVIAQWPIRHIALWAMQTPEDVMENVTTYFNICIWGAPAVLGCYGLTGWFIGLQNTKVPMTVAIAQNVMNILLSLTLVYGCGMKIEGVAIGTMASQWLAFLASAFMAKRLKDTVENRTSESIPGHTDTSARRIFSVNRDIFLRTLCLVAVNMYFTSAGSAQGSMTLAANTLLITLFTIFSYIMDGIAFAGEALGGKFYGARDFTSLRTLAKRLLAWGLAMAIAFTMAYVLGGTAFLSLLTDDTEVIEVAMEYLPFVLLVPVASFMAFIFDGIFIGLTMTKGMLLSCAMAAAVFFASFFSLFPILGNNALWLAYLLFLAMRGGIQCVIWDRKEWQGE